MHTHTHIHTHTHREIVKAHIISGIVKYISGFKNSHNVKIEIKLLRIKNLPKYSHLAQICLNGLKYDEIA